MHAKRAPSGFAEVLSQRRVAGFRSEHVGSRPAPCHATQTNAFSCSSRIPWRSASSANCRSRRRIANAGMLRIRHDRQLGVEAVPSGNKPIGDGTMNQDMELRGVGHGRPPFRKGRGAETLRLHRDSLCIRSVRKPAHPVGDGLAVPERRIAVHVQIGVPEIGLDPR